MWKTRWLLHQQPDAASKVNRTERDKERQDWRRGVGNRCVRTGCSHIPKKVRKELGMDQIWRCKESACQRRETQVQSLGWEDPLKEDMATHSSILAWEN